MESLSWIEMQILLKFGFYLTIIIYQKSNVQCPTLIWKTYYLNKV